MNKFMFLLSLLLVFGVWYCLAGKSEKALSCFVFKYASSNAMAENSKIERFYHLSEDILRIRLLNTDCDINYDMEFKLDEEKRKELERELLGVIKKHSLDAWNDYGCNESDMQMIPTDTHRSFGLTIEYTDGEVIEAYSACCFPKNFHGALSDIKKIFEKYCIV